MSDINSCIHDIKNKITLLQSFNDKLGEGLSVSERDSHYKCLQQVGHLLDRMYLMANGEETLCVQKVGIRELNLSLLECLRDLNILYPKIIFNYDYESVEAVLDFSIDFDAHLFFQVLDNLASNSVRANADIVEYTLSVGDEGLHITIRDNGEGTNFNDSRSSGMIPHGQGMGIVQKNMNKMNGSASMLNTKDEGYLANLFFPRIP